MQMKSEIVGKMRKARTAYPADIDTSTSQGKFHLGIYAEVQKLWGEEPASFYLGNFPIFFTSRDRSAFMRWWRRYSRSFEGGEAQPSACFFPGVPKGIIGRRSAAFLSSPHGKADGYIAYVTGTQRQYSDAETERSPWKALSGAYEEWVWFAAHCRYPVWRIFGGWLFSDASDLAHYQLAHSERKENT